MAPHRWCPSLLPLLLLACGPSPADTTTTAATATDSGQGTTHATSHATSHATATGGPTTGMVSGTGSTAPEDSQGTSSSSTSSPCGFLCPPDIPPGDDCDPWAQDCPEGQKCTVQDGFDDTHCVDIVPEPQGLDAPCTYADHLLSGHDDCGPELVCWGVDPDTGVGTCHALCGGTPDAPQCDDPALHCWPLCQSCVIEICIASCDPRQDTCPGGQVCVPEGGPTFSCVIDASGDAGQAFDACEYINTCDPGLVCVGPELAVECDPMASGCCLPFCTTTMPMCPGAGQECLPWFEVAEAPPGLEDLGVCGLPA